MCSHGWLTRSGSVSGWRGDSAIHLEIARGVDGVWTLNGEPVSGLDECLDVDLVTPATNWLIIGSVGIGRWRHLRRG
jgi:hypothetical protein